MLPQQPDRRLRDGQRVCGVDPLLREPGGVRRLPLVVDLEERCRDDGPDRDVPRRGVRHHRGVSALEGAAFQQAYLPAGAQHLLGGRAHHRDGQTCVVSHRSCADARAGGARRDDVVPAGVADAGKRVVFRADDDVQRAGALRRAERRRQAADAGFDGEASGVQRLLQPAGRLLLLVAQFRVRVDAAAQPGQVAARRVDGGSRSLFRVRHQSSCPLYSSWSLWPSGSLK